MKDLLVLQSRDIDRKKPERVKDANMYYFIESCVALFISFIINVFVVAVFANGLYLKTNNDVVSIEVLWYAPRKIYCLMLLLLKVLLY